MGPELADYAGRPDQRGHRSRPRRRQACVRGDVDDEKDRRRQNRGGVSRNEGDSMSKIIGALALVLAFTPLAYAETVGDKARELKSDAVQAKRQAGAEIRSAGRTVKKKGRKV